MYDYVLFLFQTYTLIHVNVIIPATLFLSHSLVPSIPNLSHLDLRGATDSVEEGPY